MIKGDDVLVYRWPSSFPPHKEEERMSKEEEMGRIVYYRYLD